MIRAAMYPIAFAAVAIANWWHKHQQKVALAWPSVEGRVEGITTAPGRDGKSCTVTAQYSYFLGEYQSGSFFRFFSTEDEADDFAHGIKDKRIQVRYDPSTPEKSLVEEDAIDAIAPVPEIA
jgi:Protein of unknown function (DUF3592)